MSVLSSIRDAFGLAEDADDTVVERLSEAIDSSQETVNRLIGEVMMEADNNDLLQERIAELEFAFEDRLWLQLQGLPTEFQFSRSGLDRIIRLSRLYYIKNPVIKRPVDLQCYYVWGQGVSIRGEGPLDKVVQGFLADPSNTAILTSHEAFMSREKDLQIEGNLFFRFFTDPQYGRVQIRQIPVDEVRSIVHNPEDWNEVWFYERKWQSKETDATTGTAQTIEHHVYYPDWRYVRQLEGEGSGLFGNGGVQMTQWAQVPIDWATPVMHRKVGQTGTMDFGIPETYAAQDWARAYKEALEDHKKIVKSLSKWAWALKTNGNRAMVDAAAKSLQSTLGSDATGWIEGNPAPVGGSIAVTGGNTSLEAVDVSKANVDPESFRRLQLMVCAAFGIPETFMGDANVGNLATSTSLDRPTELKFKDRQTLWASIIQDILTIVIEAAARAPGNDNCHAMDYDPITGQLRITATDSDSDEPIAMTVTVDFPPILQRDVQAQMQALVTAVTMNGQPIQVMNDGPTLIRLIATALGIDNTDKIVELFYPADDSDSKARPIETYSGPPTPDVGHAGAMKPADPTGQKTEASPSPNAVAAAGDAAATHAAEAMRDALAKLTSVLEAQSPAEPKE